MMNGYAMSGWGWLLMTLGLFGFWALVAVFALALLQRPGQPDQQPPPDQQSTKNADRPHGSIARSAPCGLAAPLPPRGVIDAPSPTISSRAGPRGHWPRKVGCPPDWVSTAFKQILEGMLSQ
jgi:hypothetical protein